MIGPSASGSVMPLPAPSPARRRRGALRGLLSLAVLAPAAVLAGQATFDDGAPLLPPEPAAAALPPCPAAAAAQIKGLYRWLVSQQNRSGPRDLSAQAPRFTSVLWRRLQRALALSPAEGRFLDFDVFSGTQEGLFGATVQGCLPAGGEALEARVAVRVGLTSRGAEARPQLLRFRLLPDPVVGWQIADISYPQPPGFRLSTLLSELLGPPR